MSDPVIVEEGIEIEASQDELLLQEAAESIQDTTPDIEVYESEESIVEEGVEEEITEQEVEAADFELTIVEPETVESGVEIPIEIETSDKTQADDIIAAEADQVSDEPISSSAAVSDAESSRNSGTDEIVRSGTTQAVNIETCDSETSYFYDYIKEYLEASTYTIDDLYRQSEELNQNLIVLNDNLVVKSQNESLYFKYMIGGTFAIFGAFLIYAAFSKFS